MKVQYTGKDNGLYVRGTHYPKGVIIEVPEHQYKMLSIKYKEYFNFLSGKDHLILV